MNLTSAFLPAASSYDIWDALLTVGAIFLLVIWAWIMITIIIDLFRDHELSGWLKAVWVFFLVFLPVLTALIYLIARGGGMQKRAIAAQKQAQKATDEYIRQVATVSPADELKKLAELRDSGAISPEEFDRLKARIVND